jgi:predicted NBD/HSP70 family sugar kinase
LEIPSVATSSKGSSRPPTADDEDSVLKHGSERLPAVVVDSYNVEIKDADGGFVGDRASKAAFGSSLERWRESLRKIGMDPFGEQDSKAIAKKDLEAVLREGDPEAAGVVHGAIEEFAQAFAAATRQLLKLKDWRQTECIVVGGGFRWGRIGELAIGRASVILKDEGIETGLVPIRNHPDDAGLIGAAQLAPSWIFEGHDTIIGVDIGGTNIRTGLVSLNLKKAADLSKACVEKSERWKHGEEKVNRDEAVDQLITMLKGLVARAERKKLGLAPFIGIGCPGRIESDGSIARGAQNLPGNWESSRFNLPRVIREAIPTIGEHDTVVVMHNDAVLQGLSEVPFMQDVRTWAVLTIGTGLGNARFTNRAEKPAKPK